MHSCESACNSDSYSIFAWIYLDDGTTGKTEYRIELVVERRAKPADQTTADDDNLANTLTQITKIANNLDAKEKANETNIKANATAISELQTNFARSEKVSLNEAVERYYAMRRGPDIYTVEELDAATAQACDVNRLDALTGLTCEPSLTRFTQLLSTGYWMMMATRSLQQLRGCPVFHALEKLIWLL